MPKWIHDRAQHIMSKNPGMNESTAWAVATQQAHASGNSPKGYGTSQGKKKAKAKFDQPADDYVQKANPKSKEAGAVNYALGAAKSFGKKITNADAVADLGKRLADQEMRMAKVQKTIHNTALVGAGTGAGAVAMHQMNKDKQAASVVDGYSLAIFAGFSDEMQKMAGPVGEAMKRFGNLVAGGAKKDIIHSHSVPLPQGRLAKVFGMKPKTQNVTTILEGQGPRVGSSLGAIKDPSTRSEALKVLGARGTLGAGAVAAGAEASKVHKEHTNERLGRAYMAGARDMYAQGQGY